MEDEQRQTGQRQERQRRRAEASAEVATTARGPFITGRLVAAAVPCHRQRAAATR